MVWPVFIVELVDSAALLQEKSAAGSRPACPTEGTLPQQRPMGTSARQGEAGALRTLPVPVCISSQRPEAQFADGLATKGALPFWGIFDVTCWPHPGSDLPQLPNSSRN